MTDVFSTLTSLYESIPSMSDISDAIGSALGTTLQNTVGQVLYWIVAGVSWVISIVYQLFEVFSGQIKVSYKGEANFLTNIFFENTTIAGVYWGMAMIGVVLCFAFTIVAVIRKMFDSADRMQTSMGAILGGTLKSILLILSMNAVMVMTLNVCNVLMQQVVYVFNAGSSLTEEQSIDFTDDQFATMGRVLNTIGNYSLNPSYNSRYNLNSCFNEIRGDLLLLQQQGVFRFYYETKDENGEIVETWQSALQELIFVANLEEELKMDVYHEGVANTLLDIMRTLETNTAFYPLEHYERTAIPLHNISFDRVLFLACTYNAAINEQFNVNPSHTDHLRGPYYSGQKDMYDFEQVAKDFNLVWGFNYIIFFTIVVGVWKEMGYLLANCAARLYNMIFLYLVAPPFIAMTPLDGGAKTKQWMMSFIVQCFGIFGSVIAMRLLLTLAPIVISTDLQIFANPIMDIYAKVLLVQAGCTACRKASAMFSGILSDSAALPAVNASDIRDDLEKQAKEAEAEDEKKANQKQQKQSGGGGSGGQNNENKQDKQKKDVDTAVSAGKLASGTGDLKDVKNVGEAAQGQKQEIKEQAGLGNVNDGANGDLGKALTDAGTQSQEGSKDKGPDSKNDSGTGSTDQSNQRVAVGNAGTEEIAGGGGGDGFYGVPPAPEFTGFRFDQGDNGGGQELKNPPPPRDA